MTVGLFFNFKALFFFFAVLHSCFPSTPSYMLMEDTLFLSCSSCFPSEKSILASGRSLPAGEDCFPGARADRGNPLRRQLQGAGGVRLPCGHCNKGPKLHGLKFLPLSCHWSCGLNACWFFNKKSSIVFNYLL